MRRLPHRPPGSTRKRASAGPFLLLALALFLGACTTPEQQLRWKNTFFDGVPQPGEERNPHEGEELPMTPAQRALAALREQKHDFSIHGPYAQKKCTQCHAGEYSNRLKAQPPTLCYQCHEEKGFPGKYQHGPYRAGLCLACHDPHRSPNAKLLVAERSQLCFTCHDATTYAAIDEHIAQKGDDCLRCHRPHSGERPYMLRKEVEPS